MAGDYSTYQLLRKEKEALAPKQNIASLQIIKRINKDFYWIETSGFSYYRHLNTNYYKQESPYHDGKKRSSYQYIENYIPIVASPVIKKTIEFSYNGKEKLVFPNGIVYNCKHYTAKSSKGEIDVWTHSAVKPYGIVKIETPLEKLELHSFGQQNHNKPLKFMKNVISGHSTLTQGCLSCHGKTCHENIDPPL